VARNKEEGGRVENALSAGEKIRVTGGSFMGLEGNVNQVDNEHGKAQVVLQVFGRETKVEISTSDLEKMAA
jgi:transcriptional antiterminator NusG